MQINGGRDPSRSKSRPARTDLLLTGRLKVRVLSREPFPGDHASPLTCVNAGSETAKMTQAPAAIFKIPTESPQLPSGKAGHPGTLPPGRSAQQPKPARARAPPAPAAPQRSRAPWLAAMRVPARPAAPRPACQAGRAAGGLAG